MEAGKKHNISKKNMFQNNKIPNQNLITKIQKRTLYFDLLTSKTRKIHYFHIERTAKADLPPSGSCQIGTYSHERPFSHS